MLFSRTIVFTLPMAFLGLFGGPGFVWSAETLAEVAFIDEHGRPQSLEGRVLVEAADGGILFEDRSQRLWTIPPQKRQSLTETERPFVPFHAEELGRQMESEFGKGFEIVRTDHYVICTNAGEAYAEWCGHLLERLLTAFLTHWRGKPLSLETPRHPLPVVIFATREEFARFAVQDAAAALAKSQGYYSVRTNRIILYDLTAENADRPRTRAEVQKKVAASVSNVATVVHEATHQMAFNCGLHTRYADNPAWLTEGMAMYFETPDLSNRTGWRTIGQINRSRLNRFKRTIGKRRSPDSLISLITSNDRMTTAQTAGDAYAEAWALTYFLIKKRRARYEDYLHRLSQKKPLVWNTHEDRLAEFKAAFGDLKELDQEFLRYIARLR